MLPKKAMNYSDLISYLRQPNPKKQPQPDVEGQDLARKANYGQYAKLIGEALADYNEKKDDYANREANARAEVGGLAPTTYNHDLLRKTGQMAADVSEKERQEYIQNKLREKAEAKDAARYADSRNDRSDDVAFRQNQADQAQDRWQKTHDAGRQDSQWNKDFRKSESERNQKNSDRTYGLQKEGIKVQRERIKASAAITKAQKEGKLTEERAKTAKEFMKQYEKDKGTQEYRAKVRSARDIRGLLSKKGGPSGPKDMAAIFKFMKILDPGSTVREGEFQNAEGASGMAQKLGNYYNKMLKGEFLSPQARQEFLDATATIENTAKQNHRTTQQHYTRMASTYGVDPKYVVIDPIPDTPAPKTETKALSAEPSRPKFQHVPDANSLPEL